MDNLEKTPQDIKKYIAVLILRTLIGFLLSFFLITSIISLPFVQTAIVNRLAAWVSEKIDHQTEIGYANIRWFDVVVLKDIRISDTQSEEMILVDHLVLDFKLKELLYSSNVNFDRAELNGAQVSMRRNSPDDDFNINYFISRIQMLLPPRRSDAKGPKPFVVDAVYLKNSVFVLDNSGRDSLKGQFDYNHFELEEIKGTVKTLNLSAGDLELKAVNLQFRDRATKLEVKNLNTFYSFTKKEMRFEDFNIAIGNSVIKNDMVFLYDSVQNLSYFVDEVDIEADFKPSIIQLQDLAIFAPQLREYSQRIQMSGEFRGRINRFDTKNLKLDFGSRSTIEGNLSMMGLPLVKETFVNAQLNKANIHIQDLKPYLNDEALQSVSTFGNTQINGRFTGFFSDFVCNAGFVTEVGNFTTDINLKINELYQEQSTYTGRLVTKNLNLGAIIGDKEFLQLLDFEGKVSGKGFSIDKAVVDMDASIKRIGIKGYNYSNVYTDARLAFEQFEGRLVIEDPNLFFNGKLNLDLRDGFEKFMVNAQLDSARLQNLGFTSNHTFVSARLDVDITGLQLDEMLGTALVSDLYIEYKDRSLEMDIMNFSSFYDTLGRSVELQSELIDGRIFGDFKFAAFFKDISEMFEEYKLAIENDEKKLETYYAKSKTTNNTFFYLDISAHLKNANPIINLFVPDLKITENTFVTGSYIGGPTTFLNLNTQIRQFSLKDYVFRRNEFSIQTNKSNASRQIYGQLHFHSDRQGYINQQKSQDLILDLDWYGNQINFYTRIDEFNGDSYLKITGKLDLLPDELVMKFNPSEMGIIGKIWHFNEDNYISFKKRNIDVYRLELSNQEQRILLDGSVSEDPDDVLFLSIMRFKMENINPLLDKSLLGMANGFVELKNYYAKREINSNLSIEDLYISDFLIGDVTSSSIYEQEENRFRVNLNTVRNGLQTIELSGYLDPDEVTDQFQLNAKLVKTNLNIIEPFLGFMFSEMQGSVDGDMQIRGRFVSPEINGKGKINQGALTFNYLKTRYNIDGDLLFENDEMLFRNMRIADVENNTGTLSGAIRFNSINDLVFNLRGNFNRLQVMNTSPADNDLFYGIAYATGNINITGTDKNLQINTTARSERGTRIYIPLEGTAEVAQQDFIYFVSREEEKAREDDDFLPVESRTEPSRITMNFDLDITPEAYCEIIFDITAGDIIRGRGNGKFNMTYDSRADFTMLGEYEITEGAYNFTLRNIINKEFAILPGSRITWMGDPYAAILDIRASYRQLASLQPILNIGDVESQSPDLARRYPAYVRMDIKGDLSNPEIDFDISIEEYPRNLLVDGVSLETQIGTFKNRLATDEQELKRQVFSLIILRNFSPQDAFNISGSVGNSLSEFISNQVSYWINQVDENLMIDLDLGSLNQEAFNTFQLRLSYSFLDGRLRITRDGGFQNERSANEATAIIGDWTVEYMLTSDGKYRIKVYSKSQFNTVYSNIDNRNLTTTGFSMMHTQSFNELKDLFKSARKQAKKLREQNQINPVEEEEDDNPYILPSEIISKEDELFDD
ncbi:MAG: translocation/assembly module TamB [Cyclobacteriaceae bacterium]|nr:translocation/assembly module TamB [Cyclobacteriaceae bacterium]